MGVTFPLVVYLALEAQQALVPAVPTRIGLVVASLPQMALGLAVAVVAVIAARLPRWTLGIAALTSVAVEALLLWAPYDDGFLATLTLSVSTNSTWWLVIGAIVGLAVLRDVALPVGAATKVDSDG